MLTAYLDPPPSESIAMTRPVRHPSVRPFRVLKAAVEAHREHGPTPFVGCAICARKTMFTGLQPRWINSGAV
jgi:hypothetical protein